MKKVFIILLVLIWTACDVREKENLVFHEIIFDDKGMILPWYDPDPAVSFDHVIMLVWNFWENMRTDLNGLPYYMNHQVWKENYNDHRGIGGDQIQMALSSWRLLYAYTGDEQVRNNMRFMADYYLSHGLSAPGTLWPGIPYPYNTLNYSGLYDGDMVIGKGFTQPDKAGSFAFELVNLYKMTGIRNYLDAAVTIANTLAKHTAAGDSAHSPLPFKIHAESGETGKFSRNPDDPDSAGLASYTTNWAPVLNLFLGLEEMGIGNTVDYHSAFDLILKWMKQYPMQNNRWGPFFEDVSGWSDTQINAMTFARFIMEHQAYFPSWQSDVKKIIDWVYAELGNKKWEKYGVTVINEQTSYRVPGNSHTARQGADELLFAKLSGNMENYKHAVRQLIWSTYMVNTDGRNSYPNNEIWLTDGYGDYVRHYLRAMAAFPELAPGDADHICSSTSVISQADYQNRYFKVLKEDMTNPGEFRAGLYYRTFDRQGTEQLHLNNQPKQILLNGKQLSETPEGEGYTWRWTSSGGILTVNRKQGNQVLVKY